MVEYAQFTQGFAFKVDHGLIDVPAICCPECGNSRVRKSTNLSDSYVRGYGLLDKKGIRNDMNLYTMTTDNDPYKNHRKQGDKDELVGKLRRNKDHKPKQTDVFMK
jgi:hypothetical protein